VPQPTGGKPADESSASRNLQVFSDDRMTQVLAARERFFAAWTKVPWPAGSPVDDVYNAEISKIWADFSNAIRQTLRPSVAAGATCTSRQRNTDVPTASPESPCSGRGCMRRHASAILA
jgi:hypothetical protein